MKIKLGYSECDFVIFEDTPLLKTILMESEPFHRHSSLIRLSFKKSTGYHVLSLFYLHIPKTGCNYLKHGLVSNAG